MFHVTARAIGGDALFRDDDDRAFFVDQLTRSGAAYRWACHAYCLMTTHYHLLIETTQDGLSRGMHRLNGNYAQRFNLRYGRRGHLFEARFTSYVVEGDDYLERACHYVLQNPVRAGLCDSADEWPWSGGLVHLETVLSKRLVSGLAVTLS
jgi:REP element-mobilizing transposase RayT